MTIHLNQSIRDRVEHAKHVLFKCNDKEDKEHFDRYVAKRTLQTAVLSGTIGYGLALTSDSFRKNFYRTTYPQIKKDIKSKKINLKAMTKAGLNKYKGQLRELTVNTTVKNAAKSSIKLALFTVGVVSIYDAVKRRLSNDYPNKCTEEKNFIKTVFELSIIGMIGIIDAATNNSFKPVTDLFKKLELIKVKPILKLFKVDKKVLKNDVGSVFRRFNLSSFGMAIQRTGDKLASYAKFPAMSVGTILIASSLALLIKNDSNETKKAAAPEPEKQAEVILDDEEIKLTEEKAEVEPVKDEQSIVSDSAKNAAAHNAVVSSQSTKADTSAA